MFLNLKSWLTRQAKIRILQFKVLKWCFDFTTPAKFFMALPFILFSVTWSLFGKALGFLLALLELALETVGNKVECFGSRILKSIDKLGNSILDIKPEDLKEINRRVREEKAKL